MKTMVFAALFLTSSTRCFAETRPVETKPGEAKPMAKKPTTEKSAKVKVDLSSPEATLRTFVAAFNEGDFASLPECIWGAKLMSKALQQRFKQEFKQTPGSYEVKDIKIFIDSNPIVLEAIATARGAGEVFTSHSRLEMRRDRQGWKIIPRPLAEFDDLTRSDTNVDMLLVTATQMADADTVFEGYGPSIRLVCVKNLQQVASAAIQFAQENDEKLSFDASNFREKLLPYAADEKLFQDPKTGNFFGMNAQLANVELGKIQNPGETVLFYTGKNDVLDFDHAGQTVIAFVDGHVRSFRQDEVVSHEKQKRLRWNP